MKLFFKRLICLTIVCILCASLTACVVTYDPADDDNTETGNGSDGSSQDGSSSQDGGSSGSQSSSKITIEETVCFEYEGFKLTAKSFSDNELKFLIENNGETSYAVSFDEVIINDCIFNEYFSETVAPGKKSNKSLSIYKSTLEEAGISKIAKITVNCHLYNPDTYVTVKTIDPFTIKTSEFDNMEARDTKGKLVYDDNDMKVIIKAIKSDSFFGKSVLLYIESNRDNDIGVSCESFAINGFMMSNPFLSETLFPGTYLIAELDIYSSDLEENDISEIEDIDFVLSFYSKTTYKELFRTDEIHYEVK